MSRAGVPSNLRVLRGEIDMMLMDGLAVTREDLRAWRDALDEYQRGETPRERTYNEGQAAIRALRSEVEAVRDEMRATPGARQIDVPVLEWAARLDRALEGKSGD